MDLILILRAELAKPIVGGWSNIQSASPFWTAVTSASSVRLKSYYTDDQDNRPAAHPRSTP